MALEDGGSFSHRKGVNDFNNPVEDALTWLLARSEEAGLSSLVIGGNALIQYGVVRMTRDLDLLIPRREREAWVRLMKGLKYRLDHEAGSFLQYESTVELMPPVDLMMVDEATWEKLSAEKQVIEGGGALPSVKHLVALKLHAITQDASRTRDREDVLALLLEKAIDPREGEMATLIQSFLSDAEWGKLITDWDESQNE